VAAHHVTSGLIPRLMAQETNQKRVSRHMALVPAATLSWPPLPWSPQQCCHGLPYTWLHCFCRCNRRKRAIQADTAGKCKYTAQQCCIPKLTFACSHLCKHHACRLLLQHSSIYTLTC
jgi:hypothetical protein